MSIPHVERNRLQGWLNIASAVETECLDQLEWNKRYCILDKDERKLSFFNDTESVLMMPQSPVKFQFTEGSDGSSLSSHKKGNTLNVLDPSFSSFQRGARQTRSFRDKVKSSLTKSVKRTSKQETLPPIQGGSVRVSRSRSFGKPDRVDQNPTMSGLKMGHSLENLHRVGSHGTPDAYGSVSLGEHQTMLDLAMRGTLSILPVHQSVSPRHSCFRIVTDTDIVYASCGSQEELDKWLTNLNNCRRPNRDHLRRLDTQLTVWVMEARNLQQKKKYFCEIYLNRILYAQTCCKVMQDILFWGEPFIFDDLPPLGSIMIKLYRENHGKKRKEKIASTELGKVEIPALILESGQIHEKWHPVNMVPSSKGNSATSHGKEKEKDNPSVRFKIQYHVVSIQPLGVYEDFLKFLRTDYGVVCEVLEPIIPAKAKDEIAQTLVYILQVGGKAKDFLCDIVMSEVLNIENENLIFRGNTFATKAVDTYMKMVGETYLHETLAPFVHTLLENEEDCEVDPTKMQPGGNLQHNKDSLVRLVKKAWLNILSSYTKFPSDLQNTLHSIRQKFGPEREDACFKLISGSIFLRFFCPAILSPSLFHLCQEYPSERTARKLTLVAKVLQNLANFARFGVKEEYMCFMNDFVMEEIKNMKEFIKKISSPHPESHPVVEWKPRHIDLGREASIMHTILSSLLKSLTLTPAMKQSIQPLSAILEAITRAGEEEEGDPLTSTFEALRAMQTTIRQFNPNSGGENSESSSEYTTPAQSQTTSPSHEQSPPPPGTSMQAACATVGSAAKVLMQSNGESPSPTTSPTHTERVSSLATHSQHAVARARTSHPGLDNANPAALDAPNNPRRKSDSELQKLKVRPASQGSITEAMKKHKHSQSLEQHSDLDEQLENSRLRCENDRLKYELERLQMKLDQFTRDSLKDESKLKKMEESKRQSDHDLQHVKESRGKVFRGLNTQTEIAMVQFKRDFDSMKRQLNAKDEIISMQEKKISSLVEANCTLRTGFQELNSLPRQTSSDSDMDDDIQIIGDYGSRSILNGHTHSIHSNSTMSVPLPSYSTSSHGNSSGVSSDLLQVISQLGSGKFDNVA